MSTRIEILCAIGNFSGIVGWIFLVVRKTLIFHEQMHAFVKSKRFIKNRRLHPSFWLLYFKIHLSILLPEQMRLELRLLKHEKMQPKLQRHNLEKHKIWVLFKYHLQKKKDKTVSQQSPNFQLRFYYVIMTSSNRGKIYRIFKKKCSYLAQNQVLKLKFMWKQT